MRAIKEYKNCVGTSETLALAGKEQYFEDVGRPFSERFPQKFQQILSQINQAENK